VTSLSTVQSYRDKIAIEAAKILAEGFVQDYHAAKLKAVKQLGYPDSIDLPANTEVESALKSYQAIFEPSDHEKLIAAMRGEALQAMKLFRDYDPRLTGSVLEGTATRYSPIEIQLFSESPKDMVIKFLDLDIPFDTEDRRIRLSKNDSQSVPVYSFGKGEFIFELTVLQPNSLRQSPLSPINGLPMERASIKKLSKMLGVDL